MTYAPAFTDPITEVVEDTSVLDMRAGTTWYSLSNGAVLGQGINGPIYLYLLEHDGLGQAPLTRHTERGPLQHGETDMGFRFNARAIQFVFGVYAATVQDLQRGRALLLRMFAPSSTPLLLRWTFPGATVETKDLREIVCYPTGGMTMPSSDRLPGTTFQRVGVMLTAPDPTWYDPTGVSTAYSLGSGAFGFAFPIEFPIQFGSSIVNQSRAFDYTGTWMAYPLVSIRGPITNPVVTNISTGEKLDFTGVTVADGDWRVIDTRYGYKTVVDGAGANRIQDLTSDSDLATFHIGAHPDVPEGTNVISITGTAANGNTEVYIAYHVRYIGI